jgi:hypothetical protein
VHNRLFRTSLWIFVASLIVGCASPMQPTTWRDTTYNGPPFRKIFVVGLSAKDLNDQRGFENIVVSTFQSAGIVAVPGWQYVPPGITPDQATMRAAVLQAGADAVLLVRLTGFNTQSAIVDAGTVVAITPNLYEGWYGPAEENVTEATMYTTLFAVSTQKPVWTFTAPTYNPATLRQDAHQYANDVTGMLQSSGFVAGR